MSVTVDRVKCACGDCVCVVDASAGVKSEGKVYCSDTCASHHKDGDGCAHHGCACHG